jgi:uncharacterized protein with gpF-like domain
VRKVLKPVHPNAGLTAKYRAKLNALIKRMHDQVLKAIDACYVDHEPIMALDAARRPLPANELRRVMQRMAKIWQHRFDEAAPKLADYFATAAADRSDRQLARILRDAGFSVKFKMTPAARDIIGASVNQSVALIKSIPSQYLTQVEGAVMRSVQQGRDLKTLTEEIEAQYGVTRRRAAFIARDQNNKATAAITRARQKELGITRAVWVHSGGGKVPRPLHVKWGRDRKTYDVTKGMYDSDEKKWIFPGELINCRCISRSVISV